MVGYETPQSLVRRFLQDTKIPGAFHGDDIAFLFGAGQEKLNEADEAVTEIYLNMLEAFVKTGYKHFCLLSITKNISDLPMCCLICICAIV